MPTNSMNTLYVYIYIYMFVLPCPNLSFMLLYTSLAPVLGTTSPWLRRGRMTRGLCEGFIGMIRGVYRGYIGIIYGLYRDYTRIARDHFAII